MCAPQYSGAFEACSRVSGCAGTASPIPLPQWSAQRHPWRMPRSAARVTSLEARAPSTASQGSWGPRRPFVWLMARGRIWALVRIGVSARLPVAFCFPVTPIPPTHGPATPVHDAPNPTPSWPPTRCCPCLGHGCGQGGRGDMNLHPQSVVNVQKSGHQLPAVGGHPPAVDRYRRNLVV